MWIVILHSLMTKSLLSNLFKPFALFLLIASVLLYSDLDKRVSNLKTEDHKILKFAYVSFTNAPTLDRLEGGIKTGLEGEGFSENKEYTLDRYNAQGDMSALNTIVGSLESKEYDLIFTACTPTIQAVSAKIKNIPIVFTAVTDGIAAGLGTSITDHFSNVTGISDLAPHDKVIQLIREFIPNGKRLGTLYNPAEANSVYCFEDMKKQAELNGFELIAIPVNTQNEILDAATVLCGKDIDAVCQILDNLSASGYSSILKATKNANIPYFGFDLTQVKDGALAVESKDFYQTGLQGGQLAIEIIKGKNPKDIPFASGKRIQVDFNEKVASHYGITIPNYFKKLKKDNNKTELNRDYKIAYIGFSNSSPVEEAENGVKDVIKELGWENQVSVDSYNAQGDMTVVSNIIDNIISKPYDMVISACTPTSQAVAHKVKDRPIVFCTVADPIFSGLGESFDKHPDNITGISVMADFEGTINIIKEIIPNCKKIGSLFNPAESNSLASKIQLEKAAKAVGIELITIPISSPSEISDATLALLSKDIDAICQITDNLTATSYSGILKEVNKSQMPYFTFMSKQVESGAFFAVSRDYYENGRDAMKLAAQIIQGESPGNIPFRMVGKTSMSFNKETQKRLGLEIPESVMKQITQTIK